MARYTTQFLLDELKRFYNENGHAPYHRELTKESGYPSYLTYVNRFGSVREAVVASGVPSDGMPEKPTAMDEDYMLILLAQYKIHNGKFPRYSDLVKIGKYKDLPHRRTYENKFGTYKKAIELAQKMIDNGDLSVQLAEATKPPKSNIINVEFLYEELEHAILAVNEPVCAICSRIRNKLQLAKEVYDDRP